MKSRKHLVFLTAALLLGTFVASAKPGPKPPKPPKDGNACKGFFEAPFLRVFESPNIQVPGSEGKLCYWEGDPTLLHAKVEVGPVQSNRTYCVYLLDAFDAFDMFDNGSSSGVLLHSDTDLDDEVFFDKDICVNGCEDEELAGAWLQPGFWVMKQNPGTVCPDSPRFGSSSNATPIYATGVRLPEESF